MMIVIWKLLGKLFKPEVKGIMGGMDTISNKIDSLGPMTKVEKISLTILLFTIFLWVTTTWTGLNSYSIALIGAVLFFTFKVIDWRDARCV